MRWTMMRIRTRDRKFQDRLAFAISVLGAWMIIAIATPEPIDVTKWTRPDTVAIAPDGLRSLRPVLLRPFPWR
ncbi:MAG: hypothetical protein Q7S02_02480 [bacterium]|nr:hypothetical protein [bacterium]